MTTFLNLGSGRRVSSVLSFVLSGDFSCSLTGSSSSAHSFYFSFCMNLGEKVIYCGLERVFLCEYPCVDCVCPVSLVQQLVLI